MISLQVPDRVSTALLIKSGAFVLLVPGFVVVLVPALLLYFAGDSLSLGVQSWALLGLIPMSAGATIYLICVLQLTLRGVGVPAPVQPTSKLVQDGLYRITRNPMYVAGTLFLWGEAIVFGSPGLAVYALVVMAAYQAGVVWLEEPALVRRFGPAYDAYCARVPRWVQMPAIVRRTGKG